MKPSDVRTTLILCESAYMTEAMIEQSFDKFCDNPRLMGINCVEGHEDRTTYVLAFTYYTEIQLAKLAIEAAAKVGQQLKHALNIDTTFQLIRVVRKIEHSETFRVELL